MLTCITVAASLTVLTSDMVFGVGLGCLVQMLETHTDVEVSASNTILSGVHDCGQ